MARTAFFRSDRAGCRGPVSCEELLGWVEMQPAGQRGTVQHGGMQRDGAAAGMRDDVLRELQFKGRLHLKSAAQ